MQEQFRKIFDTRTFLLKSAAQIIIIVAAGLVIKFGFIDLLRIDGNQMSPSIIEGDHVLVFRTPYLPLIEKLFKPGINKPVIFSLPFQKGKTGALRVAGHSGDTVTVDTGVFVNNHHPSVSFPGKKEQDELIPENFSPRDYFPPLRIPAPRDTFFFNKLSMRDFFIILSVARQENAPSGIDLKSSLMIDDSLSNDYFIENFSLYNGTVDSVPQDLKFDWFFWARLEEYLRNTLENKKISLRFTLLIEGKTVDFYTVKNNYVFLLAENWNAGLDSRYFGPVREDFISSRVLMVLWSWGKDKNSKAHFRLRRFGRIIS